MNPPIETELKLRIAPAAIASLRASPAIAAAALGPWRVARLDNRYFDTKDHALANHRLALRLRRVGRRWVQTLKAAGAEPDGALTARSEWESPVDGPRLALYRLRTTPLGALGSPRSLASRLAPVFTTNFRREARLLALRDGMTVEMAIDRGVVTTGRGRTRRRAAICEVELEIKDAGAVHGDDAHAELLRFAMRLSRQFPLLPLAESKAARGARLVAGRAREPARVVLPVTAADADATAHALAVISACARVAIENLHALIDATDVDTTATGLIGAVDPEFVHQARVAVRKLRSATHVFGRVLGKRRVRRIDDAWREVGRMLGGVRDWDVFMGSLPDIVGRMGDEAPADPTPAIDGVGDERLYLDADDMAAMHARADGQRAVAQHVLADALASPAPGFAALVVERERLSLLRRDRAALPVEDLAREWLDAQEDRVLALARRIASLDDETRHRLRIEIKRLRYGLEFFAGLFDDEAYVDVLGDLQEELGKLTDAVVQRARIPSLFDGTADGAIALRAASNYDAWLRRRLVKKLPKVASLAVSLEMNGRPWHATAR